MKIKMIFVGALLSVFVLSGFYFVNEKVHNQSQLQYKPRTEGYGFAGALGYYNDLHRNRQTGEVNPKDYYKAMQEVASMPHLKNYTLGWKNIGPDNIGGRTRAILIDKNNPNIIYAGAVSGGLYKSENGGLSWKLVGGDDMFTSSAVSCIAQAPNGDIYVGTGEYFAQPSGTNLNTGIYGQGMWKSTDGNTFVHLTSTWDTTTLVDNASIWRAVNAIAVRGDGRVYAATLGGLKYSDDGGETWNSIVSSIAKDVVVTKNNRVIAVVSSQIIYSDDGNSGTFNPATGLGSGNGRIKLAVSPSDPNYVYALVANTTGGFKNVYKSTDGGETFSPIFNYVPTDFTVFGSNNQGWYDNIIAVYPDNPEKILFGGVDLWTYDPSNNYNQVSAWYLSEANPKYVHADQHAIVFHPNYNGTSNKKIYVGCDGGIFLSDDGGENWHNLNASYVSTQFYGLGISNTDAVIGGAQDNGCIYVKMKGYTPHAGFKITGGDGGDAEISLLRPDVLFTTMYYGQLFRVENYGSGEVDHGMYSNFVTSFHNIGVAGGGEPFVTRIALWESFNDPYSTDYVTYKIPEDDTIHSGDTILAMSNTKYRYIKHVVTLDETGGDGIMVHGDSLVLKDPYQSVLAVGLNGDVYVTRQALDFSKIPCEWGRVIGSSDLSQVSYLSWSADGNTLFVGDYDGDLFRVSGFNYARTVAEMNYMENDFALDVAKIHDFNTIITSIAVDPQDANNIVVTLGGYNGNHIYYSTNALEDSPSFDSKDGNLPDMPVYASVIRWDDNNFVMIGTDFGVFLTENISQTNPTWEIANTGDMGYVPVFVLKQQVIPNFWYDDIFHGGNSGIQNHGVIYAASHGRGFFKLDDFRSHVINKPIAYNKEKTSLRIYPNPATDKTFVEIGSNNYKKETLTIYALNGQVVMQKDVNLIKGQNKISLNLNSLQQGVYIVKLGNKNARLIKQ